MKFPTLPLRRIQPAQSLVLLILAILLTFSGCASFNCTTLEDYIGGETDLIAFSYSIADELTAKAYPPLVARHPEMPILVTTFVDNNDLSNTTRFGRILQEHTASRLVQQGYAVKEVKMAKDLLIDPRSGETMLSRDSSRLSSSLQAQAILVGTTSFANRTMYVSARLLNPADNTIIASGDYRLCMDDNILAMFGLKRDRDSSMIKEPRRPLLNSLMY